MSSQLYKTFITDHFKNPRNKGLLENFTHEAEASNASCGDEIHLTLELSEVGVITNVGYEVSGCAVSLASMSILSEKLIGMKIKEALNIDDRFMFEMMGIEPTTGRSKCVLLSRDALRSALDI